MDHDEPPADGPALLLFDGECALCHGTVRLLLARDPDGSRFRFVPQQEPGIAHLLPPGSRGARSGSVVLRLPDGRCLQRSAAVLEALRRLGGGWAALAAVAAVLPAGLLDPPYRAVAALRRALFRRPASRCPVVASSLASRFVPPDWALRPPRPPRSP